MQQHPPTEPKIAAAKTIIATIFLMGLSPLSEHHDVIPPHKQSSRVQFR
jgi:hypothetical protein